MLHAAFLANLSFSCIASNTALCTNLQCTVAEDTFELLAEVNPLDYLNVKWNNKQLDLEILQLPKIPDDAGEAFTAPMLELLNKYADVLTKPGKAVVRDNKHKFEL